jgi:hypothetical protein
MDQSREFNMRTNRYQYLNKRGFKAIGWYCKYCQKFETDEQIRLEHDKEIKLKNKQVDDEKIKIILSKERKIVLNNWFGD